MISTSGHLIPKFPEVRFHRTRIFKQKWKESGMSEKDIEKLINLYHNFDVGGHDKGCNYSNTEIAYDVSELGYENCIR